MVDYNNRCPHCGREFDGKPYFCNFCGGPIFLGNHSGNVNHSPVQDNEVTKLFDNDNTSQQDVPTKKGTKSNNSTSRYSSANRLMIETDDVNVEPPQKEQNKSSKWVVVSLVWFFIILIAAGVTLFFMYDKKFDERKSSMDQIKTDSINAINQAKLDKLKKEKELEDSLRKDEFLQIQKEDSIENARKREEWKQDSALVDKNMSDFIYHLSTSNKILGKYFDYDNCLCFYTDTVNPIFKLTCYDGKAEEIGDVVIDNIQGKLAGNFTTPDGKSLIVLCKDTVHDYGMAYKVNMKANTIFDYKAMDDQGNKCFDIGLNSTGFFMKFGKGNNQSFVNLYTSYFDKYGNFVNKE